MWSPSSLAHPAGVVVAIQHCVRRAKFSGECKALTIWRRHRSYECLKFRPQLPVRRVWRPTEQLGLREVQASHPSLPVEKLAFPLGQCRFATEGGPRRFEVGGTMHFCRFTPSGFMEFSYPSKRIFFGFTGDATRPTGRRLCFDTAIPQRLRKDLAPRLDIRLGGTYALTAIS
jgi:hypothetical protein